MPIGTLSSDCARVQANNCLGHRNEALATIIGPRLTTLDQFYAVMIMPRNIRIKSLTTIIDHHQTGI